MTDLQKIRKAIADGTRVVAQGADLRSADLRSADLGGANLWSANLWSANLGGADLGGADLGGVKGLIAVTCSHGWTLFLIRHGKGPKILCGCHWFTVKEAVTHWEKHSDKQRQKVVLPMLKAALAIAEAEGWKL